MISSSNASSFLKPGGSTGPMSSADAERSACGSLHETSGGKVGPNTCFSGVAFSGFVRNPGGKAGSNVNAPDAYLVSSDVCGVMSLSSESLSECDRCRNPGGSAGPMILSTAGDLATRLLAIFDELLWCFV